MPFYLKLGDLKGAVTAGPYKDWIEIDHYSWGFQVPVHTPVGATTNRVPSGKVHPGDIHLTKRQDPTSCTFMLQSLQGKNTTKGTFAVTLQASETGADRYMEFEMENLICSSFNSHGSAGGDSPHESISLNFTKITFNQYLKDASGKETVMRGVYDFTLGAKVG